MKRGCSKTERGGRWYSPAALGNGDLSLLVDFTGGNAPVAYDGHKIMPCGIWRAGHRQNSPGWELISFGYFEHELLGAGEIVDWHQSLDVTNAITECEVVYANGVQVHSEVYCLLDLNLVVIKKRVSGLDGGIGMRYHFNPHRTRVLALDSNHLAYEIDTFHPTCGITAFWSVGESSSEWNGQDIVVRSSGSEEVFYLAFDRDAEEYAHRHTEAEIRATHVAAWASFWADSTVPAERLPENVLSAARTAEYYLRIASTKWSIPPGIFPCHWQGRYFGFDEYFSMSGLLASGHVSVAKKVVEFRRSHLQAAHKRAYEYFKQNSSAARYVWEAMEEPGVEGCPGGFYLDHIFHEANIALEAWSCYEALSDIKFLREQAYPVMRGCAEFFRIHCLERKDDGRVIIGKCTDLERLGAARENAYMTTCGAILTFRKTALAASLLNLDEDLQNEWKACDEGLTASLPVNEAGDAYVPYPGCKESSIALLSGLFPYPCLKVDNARQRKAIEEFVSQESQVGNMYPVGKNLCTWYAGWKALAFNRLGEREIARQVVGQMADDTGCFCETFEICETGSRPWFTTGSGALLQAICEIYG